MSFRHIMGLAAAAALFSLSAGSCGVRTGTLCGGIMRAPADDEMVVEAAEFAVERVMYEDGEAADITLRRVRRAGQQVVAGMNYYLVLDVASGRRVRMLEAVVWRRLSGEHELISWEWR